MRRLLHARGLTRRWVIDHAADEIEQLAALFLAHREKLHRPHVLAAVFLVTVGAIDPDVQVIVVSRAIARPHDKINFIAQMGL